QQQIEPKYPIKRTFEKGVSYGFFSAY
ncbi:TPA: hypothetical protein ACJUI9_002782, partial [Listeria monocytogenes]